MSNFNIFTGPSPPENPQIGDQWLRPNGGQKTWNGTGWEQNHNTSAASVSGGGGVSALGSNHTNASNIAGAQIAQGIGTTHTGSSHWVSPHSTAGSSVDEYDDSIPDNVIFMDKEGQMREFPMEELAKLLGNAIIATKAAKERITELEERIESLEYNQLNGDLYND